MVAKSNSNWSTSRRQLASQPATKRERAACCRSSAGSTRETEREGGQLASHATRLASSQQRGQHLGQGQQAGSSSRDQDLGDRKLYSRQQHARGPWAVRAAQKHAGRLGSWKSKRFPTL